MTNIIQALSAAAKDFRNHDSYWQDSTDLYIRIFEHEGNYRARFWDFEKHDSVLLFENSQKEVQEILNGNIEALESIPKIYETEIEKLETIPERYKNQQEKKGTKIFSKKFRIATSKNQDYIKIMFECDGFGIYCSGVAKIPGVQYSQFLGGNYFCFFKSELYEQVIDFIKLKQSEVEVFKCDFWKTI